MHPTGNPATLPDPDSQGLERSARVSALVQDAIEQAGGWITFERYMRIVLYAEDLGYYAHGERIFGGDGDFVTAPESGSLFARCLAAQCAEILGHLGGGTLVEYGAGSGRLAVDLLAGLAARGTQPDRLLIVEPSAGLAARQREVLTGAAGGLPVGWLAGHPDEPVDGVIVANEVLDALPVARFVVRGGVARELGVAAAGPGFAWAEGEEVPGDVLPHAALATLPDGYVSEYSPNLPTWIAGLRAGLRRGVALLVDYGYPRHEYLHPSRTDGTLKCHYRHRVHDDPFLLPGLQDVTAAVDFTAVAEAAVAAGFDVAGYASQTRFLLGCGLEACLAEATEDGSGVHGDPLALAREARRLMLPTEMGQTCRALALAVDYDEPLRGFADDERHRLSGLLPG